MFKITTSVIKYCVQIWLLTNTFGYITRLIDTTDSKKVVSNSTEFSGS